MNYARSKFLLLAVIIGFLGSHSISKAITVTAAQLGSEPGFDIVNKESRSIWVVLVVDGKFFGTLKIDPNMIGTKVVDPTKDLVIGVYYADPGSVSLGLATEISPKPDFTYGFQPTAIGKTKYLTWNPARYNNPSMNFYPQIGEVVLRASIAGYRLTFNVGQADITLKATK